MGYVIYGATGYTGELIARRAVSRGDKPILAGRSRGALEKLATDLGLEHRVFSLGDQAELDAGLRGARAVLHCAGPFSRTSQPMIDACIRQRVHYLDITGDVAVFEASRGRDAEARASGIMLLPGAGFDVVPSDCLAVHLKGRLPSATRLTLGFEAGGGVSRGTAITLVEKLHKGGTVRRNGVLESVPLGHNSRVIDFGRGATNAMTIPWGDLSTAWRSTAIPNIEVYMAAPTAVRIAARAVGVMGAFLANRAVQQFLIGRINARQPGPTEEQRAGAASYVWGEVTDDAGGKAVARLRTPDGYTLTSYTALAIVDRVLSGDVHPGYQTPASAYGPDFILTIDGCSRTNE
jgi:short subunit dehydrogenase-like uncharacterized protein